MYMYINFMYMYMLHCFGQWSRAVRTATHWYLAHIYMHVARSGSVAQEPVSVPYLSPLVLRKELETVIGREGDLCLTRCTFVDEHPIIYWNLLYFFKRLQVDSHLPGFVLAASVTNSSEQPVRRTCTGGRLEH